MEFERLPVFVYGTLRPGGLAFRRIALFVRGIERAVLLAEGNTIRQHDISIHNEVKIEMERDDHIRLSSLAVNEKESILDALRKNDWIQKDAADTLGISKRVIHYKIKKYGITHPRWIKNR